MEMKDIIGKRIKLSANSITVKDENGKTRGIVRGARRFKDCCANQQIEIRGKIKKAGISFINVGVNFDCVVNAEGKWWYINDLKWESDYFKYFEGRDENIDKKYQNRRNIYDALVNENVMEVIDCWILR